MAENGRFWLHADINDIGELLRGERWWQSCHLLTSGPFGHIFLASARICGVDASNQSFTGSGRTQILPSETSGIRACLKRDLETAGHAVGLVIGARQLAIVIDIGGDTLIELHRESCAN
jgi:hypothetical protein